MVEYEAPLRDYEFLFNEVFDVTPTMKRLGYDFDEDFLSMLAEGWADHAKEVWLPINQLGDRVGLKFENGEITMPKEFKDAYNQARLLSAQKYKKTWYAKCFASSDKPLPFFKIGPRLWSHG